MTESAFSSSDPETTTRWLNPLALYAPGETADFESRGGPSAIACRPVPHEVLDLGQVDASAARRVLEDAHARLPENGSIVVAAWDSGYRHWSLIRRLGLGSNLTGAMALSPRRLAALLGECGFRTLPEVFVASPSPSRPERIWPRVSWHDAWSTPAYLLVGSKAGAPPPSRLQRILDAVDAAHGPVPAGHAAQMLRMFISTRGKCVALIRSSNREFVARIACSELMDEDERRSHRILEGLQTDSTLARWVPRPITSGHLNGASYFVQSRLSGVPLSTVLRPRNRAAYVQGIHQFLRALNPRASPRVAVSLDQLTGIAGCTPIVDYVLSHVSDSALRAESKALLQRSLSGATSRRGIVHGDLGTGNVLVNGESLSGIIDWEAAREDALPVLDAFNYLDSVHRTCNPRCSMVDTIPLLARGDWPVPAELDFLKARFDGDGIDFGFRAGFAMLYFFCHIGPQLRFADRDAGPVLRLTQVLKRMVQR